MRKYLLIALVYIATIDSINAEQKNEGTLMLQICSPVKGIYITPNTPGSKVPSHGTTGFGEEYAIDFLMIKENGFLKKPYRKSMVEYVFKGIDLTDFYGYGQTIYSPIAGEVVKLENNIDERNPVNIFNDIDNTRKVTNEYINQNGSSEIITGNYVLIKKEENVYLLLAHLRKNSIKVSVGQKIKEHDEVAQLGHSGNSTMPHLHMQFMDNSDYRIAQGVPFVFKTYEIKKKGKWLLVSNDVPKDTEVIRFEK